MQKHIDRANEFQYLKMAMIEFFLILILPFTSSAEEYKFDKLIKNDRLYKTRESTVTIDNVRYRKVEIENKYFYISMTGRRSDAKLYCERPGGHSSEHLVHGSVKIMRRKTFYIQALKETCNPQNNQTVYTLKAAPQIGFFLPESPRDLIKNKKLGINPLNPDTLQFSGDF